MLNELVVLGFSGDLTGRYLLPALGQLENAGLVPDDAVITGVDREDVDEDEWRDAARAQLAEHAPDLPGQVVDSVVNRLRHARADVTDADDLRDALAKSSGPVAIYLALPSTLFIDTVRTLGSLGLPDGSRLVVEKPFGTDLDNARRLNEAIRSCFHERDVFRVDHFLAKQTVLNVLGLRFANRIFEPVWNSLHVESVEITWDETLTVEGRAGYYDQAGALKDMIQNHLLQLLALVAMEPPTSLGERDLRDRKVEVLRATRAPSPDDLASGTTRARYTAGSIGDRSVPDYADEPGVDPDRETETFAEVTLHVDNWRWSGVPFVLRSGKALGADRRDVTVRFRPTPHLPFPGAAPPDELRFVLGPDELALDINLNGGGDPFVLERDTLATSFPGQHLPPYAMLLRAVLAGDPTLSIRGDEAEESWRVVSPVLEAWARGDVPLDTYPAGSSGPGTD
jgi:glucose-6-phosphate 1-dehydrogenase